MKRLIMVLLGAVLGSGAAGAADIAAPGRAPLAPPVLPEDFSSGWYVRGDVAASLFRAPSMGLSDTATVAPGAWVALRDTRAGQAFGGSIGLGFKYKWLRVDATVDLRSSAALSGMAPPGGNWSHAGPLPVPARTERFGVTGQTAFLSAYAELGSLGKLAPYVGLGIGAARLSAGGYSSVPVPAAAGLGEATVVPALSATTRWTLAWTAMAGLAVDVTPQTKIDLGYRYVHMGALRFADTGGGAYRATAAAHEFRIGLRYMFGDGLGGP